MNQNNKLINELQRPMSQQQSMEMCSAEETNVSIQNQKQMTRNREIIKQLKERENEWNNRFVLGKIPPLPNSKCILILQSNNTFIDDVNFTSGRKLLNIKNISQQTIEKLPSLNQSNSKYELQQQLNIKKRPITQELKQRSIQQKNKLLYFKENFIIKQKSSYNSLKANKILQQNIKSDKPPLQVNNRAQNDKVKAVINILNIKNYMKGKEIKLPSSAQKNYLNIQKPIKIQQLQTNKLTNSKLVNEEDLQNLYNQLQNTWNQNNIPIHHQDVFRNFLNALSNLTFQKQKDILLKEISDVEKQTSPIQLCLVAINARENCILQLYQNCQTIQQYKQQQESHSFIEEIVNKSSEMLTHLRILSINVIECILKWKNSFKEYLLFLSKSSENLKVYGNIVIPFIISDRNYVLKMKRDLNFLFGSSLANYFNFTKNDPFLIYPTKIQIKNKPIYDKIVQFISKNLIQKIRDCELVIIEETLNEKIKQQQVKQQSQISSNSNLKINKNLSPLNSQISSQQFDKSNLIQNIDNSNSSQQQNLLIKIDNEIANTEVFQNLSIDDDKNLPQQELQNDQLQMQIQNETHGEQQVAEEKENLKIAEQEFLGEPKIEDEQIGQQNIQFNQNEFQQEQQKQLTKQLKINELQEVDKLVNEQNLEIEQLEQHDIQQNISKKIEEYVEDIDEAVILDQDLNKQDIFATFDNKHEYKDSKENIFQTHDSILDELNQDIQRENNLKKQQQNIEDELNDTECVKNLASSSIKQMDDQLNLEFGENLPNFQVSEREIDKIQNDQLYQQLQNQKIPNISKNERNNYQFDDDDIELQQQLNQQLSKGMSSKETSSKKQDNKKKFELSRIEEEEVDNNATHQDDFQQSLSTTLTIKASSLFEDQVLDYLTEHLYNLHSNEEQSYLTDVYKLQEKILNCSESYLLQLICQNKLQGHAIVHFDQDYFICRRITILLLTVSNQNQLQMAIKELINYVFCHDSCQELRVNLSHFENQDSHKYQVDPLISNAYIQNGFKWKNGAKIYRVQYNSRQIFVINAKRYFSKQINRKNLISKRPSIRKRILNSSLNVYNSSDSAID